MSSVCKAKKKSMKGPDPADFYPGLFKQSWKFVGKNQKLAWRTVVYSLVSQILAMAFLFLYHWVSPWPPRVFLAFCFSLSFLTLPGWMWVLDTEIIKLTLERKDKFKRLNFDFFLSSAMGVALVFWCAAVLLPIMIVPATLGYFFLQKMGGWKEVIWYVSGSVAMIPALFMLPVAMSHMCMPVQWKGWMVWQLVPITSRHLKPLSVWVLFFLVTNIPNIAGVTAIAWFSGADLMKISRTMEKNADIARKIFAQTENPNAKGKNDKVVAAVKIDEPKDVDYMPLILPSVIVVLMCIANGFTSMFNMRTNGQFTYYFKNSLELVDRKKEYKYVSRTRSEDDDGTGEPPKTASEKLLEAIVVPAIVNLFGLVGGAIYGMNNAEVGYFGGLVYGLMVSNGIASLIVYVISAIAAFKDSPVWGAITLLGAYPIGFIVFISKKFEERKEHLFRVGLVSIVWVLVFALNFSLQAAAQAKLDYQRKMEEASRVGKPKVDENAPADGAAQPAGGPRPDLPPE